MSMRPKQLHKKGSVQRDVVRNPPSRNQPDIHEGEVAPKCGECPFAVNGIPCHKPVRPQISVKHPQGILVGEGPGRDEVVDGRPFTGRTGEELDLLLAENRVPRSKLLIINAIGCMPGPSLKTEGNMRAAANACRPWMKSIIRKEVRKPLPTLAMGKWAGFLVTGKPRAVGDRRGFIRTEEPGQLRRTTPLILTWHPTFALFFNPWEAGNFEADLNRWARAMRGQLQAPPKALVIVPTLGQIKSLWKEPFITCDIETGAFSPKVPWTGKDPTQARIKVIGLGTKSHGYAMWWAGTDWKIKEEVKKLLASKKLLKVFQNGHWFDIRILRRFGFSINNVADIRDLRRAQVTTSRLSLGYMASIFLDVPDWKDKGGEDGKA